MSLYELTKDISNVTRTKYTKLYPKDYVVAKFTKNNNTINLYYKNYSKKLLKDHMFRDYDEKYVSMYFWDPIFCSYKNISDEDIRSLDRLGAEVDVNVAISYVMASIALHEIILKTYTDSKYDIIRDSQSFDKNTIRQVLCDFDMVIEFNNELTNFINNVFDDNSMNNFMITPSGKFRFVLKDVRYFLMGTKRVHDVSSAIVDTMKDVPEILN